MHDAGIGRRRGACAAALLAGLGAVLALGAPARGGADYSWDTATAVVRWREMPAEVGDPRAAVTVTAYGDGRVVVARGAGRRDPGEHTLRLSRAEMNALVRTLADGGLLSFDARAARQAKREANGRRVAAARAGDTLRVVSDVGTTVIEVHLDQGQRTIVWTGVQEDAREYPEIGALRGLAAADAALRALGTDPRLRRGE